MPPRDITGPRKVNRKPARKAPPKGVFGPIGRADAPITRARAQAHERTRKARQPILKRTSVPYVPKIRQPTRQQRRAQVQIVGQGLRRQGVTTREVRALQRGEGTRQQQQAVNRYVAAAKADIRKGLQQVGRQYSQPAPVSRIRDSIREPGPGAPFALIDVLRPDKVTLRPRYLPTGREEFERAGRQIAGQVNPRAQAGSAPSRVGLGPATINLTAASRAVSPYIAKAGTIPLSFAKGMAEIASQRVFSDKGVLGRTANDLLTYPAAAIPTAYEAVTNPRGLAKGVVEQVTHPLETTREHPLFGALLAHGGVAAVGRGTGAIARSGALGAEAQRAGGLVRPPLALAGTQGTRLLEQRRYSRSLPHKAIQTLVDRRRAVVGKDKGRPVLATRPREQQRLLHQRADFLASRANAMERVARQEEAVSARRAAPKRGRLGRLGARTEREVVAMAMEGTLRSPESFVADLTKERRRLDDVYRSQSLDPAQKYTNRVRARSIDRVLRDPGALRNSGAVFDSARTLSKRSNELEQEAVSLGMLDPAAAERAKLFPYAQSHMGAKPVAHSDGIVSLRAQDGTFLSNEQVRSHMRDEGTGPVVNPDDVAYLPHRPDIRGATAFHAQFRPRQRKNLDTQRRTGTAYEKGATAADYEAPVEHLVRTRNLIANVREHDRLISDAGIRKPNGDYWTWDEAKAYADRSNRAPNEATNRALPGEPDLVPVRALPAKYGKERRQQIQDELQDPSTPGAATRLLEDSFRERLAAPPPGDKTPNVVLVPRQIVDRLQDQLRSSSPGARGFQAATSAFRTTVLPFSTKWLTGNVAEAVLRLAAVGASPRDVGIGRRLFKELEDLDSTAAKQTKGHLTGGLLYGERGLTNRRTAADVSQGAGTIARLPVVHELGQTLKAVTGGIFAVNRAFERGAQYAALGKYSRREIHALTGSWSKSVAAQKQALRDVAKGLTNTEAQVAAARYLDETLGRYSRFSPTLRHAIQTYAPFLPWYLNAARFVAVTLPLHHPIKTAVLTQAEAAFEQDWRDQHKGVPPGLKSSVPSRGGYVDVARYTPFGLAAPVASGEFGLLAGVVLPQVSGAQLALMGKNPFGDDLTTPGGEVKPEQIPLVALNTLAEGYIPGLSLGRRLREGGGKSFGTSTVFSPQASDPKSGPKPSAVSRVFNPFRPVYVSESRQKKSKDPLAEKYGLKSGRSIDEISKKYGLDKGSDVDELAKKYGLK